MAYTQINILALRSQAVSIGRSFIYQRRMLSNHFMHSRSTFKLSCQQYSSSDNLGDTDKGACIEGGDRDTDWLGVEQHYRHNVEVKENWYKQPKTESASADKLDRTNKKYLNNVRKEYTRSVPDYLINESANKYEIEKSPKRDIIKKSKVSKASVNKKISSSSSFFDEQYFDNSDNISITNDTTNMKQVTFDGHSKPQQNLSEQVPESIDDQYFGSYTRLSPETVYHKNDDLSISTDTNLNLKKVNNCTENEEEFSTIDEHYFGNHILSTEESVMPGTKMGASVFKETKLSSVGVDADTGHFNIGHVGSTTIDSGSLVQTKAEYKSPMELQLKPKKSRHNRQSDIDLGRHSDIDLGKHNRQSDIDLGRHNRQSDIDVDLGKYGNAVENKHQTNRKQKGKNMFRDVSHQDAVSPSEIEHVMQSVDKDDNEKPETAYELAMKIRSTLDSKTKSNILGKAQPNQFDNKGFKILKDQVPNFSNVLLSDIITLMRNNIIYNDNDIVALNKPYGLPSVEMKGSHVSISRILDKLLPCSEPLHMVQWLDRETTGVILLAKTQAMERQLKEAFKKQEAVSKYWAVVKNKPRLFEGVIDIPIKESEIDGKYRMGIAPYYTPDVKDVVKKRDGEFAMTKFRTLSEKTNYSLLECIPLTNVKHQLRVHLSFGINCTILGDHKYSHTNSLAPQKLHPDMLRLLNIRQSKARHVPMHLHLRSVFIKDFFEYRYFHVAAPLPVHFLSNAHSLRLNIPQSKHGYRL